MPPLITSWMSNGQLITVLTAWVEPETARQHAARHQAAVDFWKEVFPEDQ